jgi:S-adenosylmethionine:tRNA ribosyltransferase-isomerase
MSASPQAPLRLADLDYELPPELIAQTPLERRDTSRLLVCGRGGRLHDRRFADLPRLLRAGDVLVRNDTRVFPARSFFRRQTGGRVEVLFLHALQEDDGGSQPSTASGERWQALLRGRPRAGEMLASEVLGAAWPLVAERSLDDGRWLVRSAASRPVLDMLADAGVTPVPPYIHTHLSDPQRYQTTYARVVGSAAAPTAGLHFTARLDQALRAAGIEIATVTLHVGLGTFEPLRSEALAANHLHSEAYEVSRTTWARLCALSAQGRRLVAVGTTTLRALEHLASLPGGAPGRGAPEPHAGSNDTSLRGHTRLFIRPGFEFRMVDALITNFHLPGTSLLALVMAFCGVAETRRIYAHAIAQQYRFYSFGDAMLAL